MRSRVAMIEAVVLLGFACAQGFTSPQQAAPPQQVAVATAPPTARIAPGASQGFSAQVSGANDTSVAWSVQEGAPGGGVTDAGVYTAPGTAGLYHVVATSNADNGKTGSSAVTVTLVVSVSTTTPSIDVCATANFSATVAGSANTAVTWSVLEGAAGGTVSIAGVYTAPSTPGTYHVVATSQADATQSASAAITVNQHILGVQVNPSPASVAVNGTVTFTAKVTNTCGTFTAAKVFRTADLTKQ